MLDTIYLGGFLAVSAVIMLGGLLRQGMFLRGAAQSAGSGLVALLAVSLLGNVLQLGIRFNLLSALTAAIYGLPGVIGMLILRMITA